MLFKERQTAAGRAAAAVSPAGSSSLPPVARSWALLWRQCWAGLGAEGPRPGQGHQLETSLQQKHGEGKGEWTEVSLNGFFGLHGKKAFPPALPQFWNKCSLFFFRAVSLASSRRSNLLKSATVLLQCYHVTPFPRWLMNQNAPSSVQKLLKYLKPNIWEC